MGGMTLYNPNGISTPINNNPWYNNTYQYVIPTQSPRPLDRPIVQSSNMSPIPLPTEFTFGKNGFTQTGGPATATPYSSGMNAFEKAQMSQMQQYNNNMAQQNNLFGQQLDLMKDAQSFNKGANIANGVFGGLQAVTNMGLGIWNAVEQSKLNAEYMANAKAQRELWAEQIAASREQRTQRKQELARLDKMRSNTKAQFNTQASVTRSY